MSRMWKQGLLALPGVGVSLLPKLACPTCWPAYAGLLSSVGLGFLVSTLHLLPVTAGLLVIALGAMAFRASKCHGYGPFLLGLFGSAGVLFGYLWNAWPRHVIPNAVAICPGYHEENNELNQRSV